MFGLSNGFATPRSWLEEESSPQRSSKKCSERRTDLVLWALCTYVVYQICAVLHFSLLCSDMR